MGGMSTTQIDRLATAEGTMEENMEEILHRNQPTMCRGGIHMPTMRERSLSLANHLDVCV